jgi:Sec-independent protein translocase protein TatA
MLAFLLIVAVLFVFCPKKAKNVIAVQFRTCMREWKDAFSVTDAKRFKEEDTK